MAARPREGLTPDNADLVRYGVPSLDDLLQRPETKGADEGVLDAQICAKIRGWRAARTVVGVGVEGGYMLKQSIDLGEIRQGKSGELDEEPPMKAGKIDLGELKENVLVGHLVPAGHYPRRGRRGPGAFG